MNKCCCYYLQFIRIYYQFIMNYKPNYKLPTYYGPNPASNPTAVTSSRTRVSCPSDPVKLSRILSKLSMPPQKLCLISVKWLIYTSNSTFEKDLSSDTHKKEQDSNLKGSFVSGDALYPIGWLTGVDWRPFRICTSRRNLPVPVLCTQCAYRDNRALRIDGRARMFSLRPC